MDEKAIRIETQPALQRAGFQGGSHERTVLRVPDVAEWLRLSQATIWALIANGSLKSFKIGSSRRIFASDVEDFLAKQAAREPVTA